MRTDEGMRMGCRVPARWPGASQKSHESAYLASLAPLPKTVPNFNSLKTSRLSPFIYLFGIFGKK